MLLFGGIRYQSLHVDRSTTTGSSDTSTLLIYLLDATTLMELILDMKNGKPGWLKNGYWVVKAPLGHPTCQKNGTIFEHRLVVEKHIGRYLTPIEVVHHINEIRTDNRIENLMLLPNETAHRNIHCVPKYKDCACGCGGNFRINGPDGYRNRQRKFLVGHRPNIHHKIYLHPVGGHRISRQRWHQIKNAVKNGNPVSKRALKVFSEFTPSPNPPS
jgi:hypothetical protein